MSDNPTQQCAHCGHIFDLGGTPLFTDGCPNCLDGACAVCSDCGKVCDPITCPMPACSHKPEEVPA